MDTKLLIALAISLAWLVCLVVCFLKAKYWMAVVGLMAAVAQEIGLPPIGSYYVLNLIYPLWLLPVFGALRLAHPKSYYAYWFYRRNIPKYFRAVQRFGLEDEWRDLIVGKVRAEIDEQFKQEGRGEIEWKQGASGQTSDRSKIEEIITQGPERIAPTIDACCEDPKQKAFAQALLDAALEPYFLLQLAIFANKKVNAHVTIKKWRDAGLKLPAEGTPEFFPYGD